MCKLIVNRQLSQDDIDAMLIKEYAEDPRIVEEVAAENDKQRGGELV